MGMMTGEPRSATVTARSDVVCYRLDKAGFAQVIRARPDIAEAVSRVLARRQAQLEGRRAAGAAAQPAPAHDHILDRIRAFFGLDEVRSRDAASATRGGCGCGRRGRRSRRSP
jgi:CRP-like cAMP-binding protein